MLYKLISKEMTEIHVQSQLEQDTSVSFHPRYDAMNNRRKQHTKEKVCIPVCLLIIISVCIPEHPNQITAS